jgi:tetratricopeptide (TPR) repeat protein
LNQLAANIQLAKQAYASGNYIDANHICDQLLARLGARDDLLNIKALSLLADGRLEAAGTAISTAIKLNPNIPGMHLNAARIFLGQSLNKLAKRHVMEAIRLAPRDATILYQAALLSRECADYSLALRVLDRCLQLQPGMDLAWHLKGATLLDLGKMEAAREALEKAVSIQPQNVRALSSLITLRGDRLADTATVKQLENIRSGQLPARDKGTATFSLAQMYRREKQYETAFELYRQANKIAAAYRPFDAGRWAQRISEQLQSGDSTQNSTPSQANAGSNLVFIVGMPRSGTSLCEQVLSTHSGILACGELATMQNIEDGLRRRGLKTFFKQGNEGSGAKELEAAAGLYLSALPKNHQKFLRVIDKAPMNFERIGMIHQIFPAARFIYCKRHPLDTILSCFIQDFHAGVDFSFDLEHITQVYIDHVKLMQHWTGMYPQQILTVHYESLVSDLETQARAMANFLQIEFDPGMLAPHLKDRVVTTASNVQVRKKVYTSSIGNWLNYRPQFEPTLRQLQAHGILEADDSVTGM